jgi:chorismate mutase
MSLGGFREQIDQIDDTIVDLLARRLDIVRLVARAKEASATPVMQPERVTEVKRRCRERAQRRNVRGDFVDVLYQLIIDEACRIEAALLTGRSGHMEPAASPAAAIITPAASK